VNSEGVAPKTALEIPSRIVIIIVLTLYIIIYYKGIGAFRERNGLGCLRTAGARPNFIIPRQRTVFLGLGVGLSPPPLPSTLAISLFFTRTRSMGATPIPSPLVQCDLYTYITDLYIYIYMCVHVCPEFSVCINRNLKRLTTSAPHTMGVYMCIIRALRVYTRAGTTYNIHR